MASISLSGSGELRQHAAVPRASYGPDARGGGAVALLALAARAQAMQKPVPPETAREQELREQLEFFS